MNSVTSSVLPKARPTVATATPTQSASATLLKEGISHTRMCEGGLSRRSFLFAARSLRKTPVNSLNNSLQPLLPGLSERIGYFSLDEEMGEFSGSD